PRYRSLGTGRGSAPIPEVIKEQGRIPRRSTVGGRSLPPGDRTSTSREGTVARVRNRTERDNEDLVRLYLEDIGRHQLLTKDDEARLAQDIEAGRAAAETLETVGRGLTRKEKRHLEQLARQGELAQREFVQSNLRLVVSIAKRYQA